MHRSNSFWLVLAPIGIAACTGIPGKSDTAAEGTNVAPSLTVDTPVAGAEVDAGTPVQVIGFVVDDRDVASEILLRVVGSGSGELAVVRPRADGTWNTTVNLAATDTLLTVSATDRDDATTTLEVGLTVYDPLGDDAPSTPAIHIDPLSPQTGDPLRYSIDTLSVDPDGLPVTYEFAWTVDGTPFAGETIPPSAVFRGQVWTLEVRAFDGTTYSAAATTSVEVVNAPPSAHMVRITPPAASVLDTLNCQIDGLSDREGDALTLSYSWTVAGTPAGDDAPTLAPAVARDGEDVVCTVLVDDGIDVASFTSAVFQIGNSAPTPPVVAILPETPSDSEDLLCAIVADSVDPDGDGVSYAYAWYRNGDYVGDVDAQVLGSDTRRDERWSCEVVATDAGGLTSAVGRAEVSIGTAWQDSQSADEAWATLDGTQEGGQFGKSIALVGDMDSDGRSEVLVSAPGEEGGLGSVYLFTGASLGGALTSDAAIARWTGTATATGLGAYRSIAAPGDVDGDGIPDLFFAAPDADDNGDQSGTAYLFYGGGTWSLDETPADSADWIVTGVSAIDQAGARLAAGDLDGDGLSDLLLAAPGTSGTARSTGVVSVFLGNGSRRSGVATMADADRRVYGDAELDQLGWTTRYVGDVTDDGYGDFLTTAMYADPSGSESGKAALVAGDAIMTGSARVSVAATALFLGDAAGDRFGYDAIGETDLNDDGVPDLLVAAYQDDTTATDAGALYLYEGRRRWAATYTPADSDASVFGAEAASRFGHALSSPGDLDADGTDDLVIGALFASPRGATYQGSAWVLLGPDIGRAPGIADIGWQSWGTTAGDLYGDAVSFGRGDLDGDGKADFAVGAQGVDVGGSSAGRVYLWRGR